MTAPKRKNQTAKKETQKEKEVDNSKVHEVMTDISSIKTTIAKKEVELIPFDYNTSKKFIKKVSAFLKEIEPEGDDKPDDTISGVIARIRLIYSKLTADECSDILPELILILSEYYELDYSLEDIKTARGYGIPMMVENIKLQLEVERDSSEVAVNFSNMLLKSIGNWDQIMDRVLTLSYAMNQFSSKKAGQPNTTSSNESENDTELALDS